MERLEIPEADDAIIVAGLMENDDGIAPDVTRAVIEKCSRVLPSSFQKRRATEVKQRMDCTRRILINQVQLQDRENDDDYVVVKELRLTEDFLSTCRTKKGWHKKNIRISGDGGRYRLQFSVKAEPR